MISIGSILVPVDFSKESALAAKFAASLALQYNSKLYVLHVKEPIPSYAQSEVVNLEAIERKVAEQIREDLSKIIPPKVKAQIRVESFLETGKAHHVIVRKAADLGIDVIVIATHGRTGLAHMMLGSVAEKVIRHAPCPVFVIRNPKDKYVYGWE